MIDTNYSSQDYFLIFKNSDFNKGFLGFASKCLATKGIVLKARFN